MPARVKITELSSGQEYLLLVSKLNLKGLLVESSKVLAVGSGVRLALQLEEEHEPHSIQGEVHKITQRPGGSPGMIIRFVDPTPAIVQRITEYVTQLPASSPGGRSASESLPSRERTMMVDVNTLSRLTLSSIEDDEDGIASTRDEEAVHSANPGLAGRTRVVAAAEVGRWSRPKKPRTVLRSLLVFLLVVAAVGGVVMAFRPLLQLVNVALGLKPTPARQAITPLPSTPNPVVTPLAAATLEPEALAKAEKKASALPPARPTPKPSPKAAKVTSIKVEDAGGFLKIVIQGDGDLGKAEASRAMNPRRLILELPGVQEFSTSELIAVSKNPLLRIRTSKRESGLQITFDLYPVDFPRYDIKEHADSLDLFLHR